MKGIEVEANLSVMVEIKKVNILPTKTTMVLEISTDETGSIDGLQALMSQTVRATFTPLQQTLGV